MEPQDADRGISKKSLLLAGPLGHFWYQKLDKVVSSCLRPSTASFVAAKVCNMSPDSAFDFNSAVYN